MDLLTYKLFKYLNDEAAIAVKHLKERIAGPLTFCNQVCTSIQELSKRFREVSDWAERIYENRKERKRGPGWGFWDSDVCALNDEVQIRWRKLVDELDELIEKEGGAA